MTSFDDIEQADKLASRFTTSALFIGQVVEGDGVSKRYVIERNTKSKPSGRFVRVVHIDIWHNGRTKGGSRSRPPFGFIGESS